MVKSERDDLIEKGLKRCSVCRVVKSLADFGKDRNAKSGLKSLCKKCNNKKNKEY